MEVSAQTIRKHVFYKQNSRKNSKQGFLYSLFYYRIQKGRKQNEQKNLEQCRRIQNKIEVIECSTSSKSVLFFHVSFRSSILGAQKLLFFLSAKSSNVFWVSQGFHFCYFVVNSFAKCLLSTFFALFFFENFSSNSILTQIEPFFNIFSIKVQVLTKIQK